VDKTTAMYRTLLVEFPDASDHMTAKQDELMAEWNSLLAKARLRRERLQQAESVQLYFDDYRGLWSVSTLTHNTLQYNTIQYNAISFVFLRLPGPDRACLIGAWYVDNSHVTWLY